MSLVQDKLRKLILAQAKLLNKVYSNKEINDKKTGATTDASHHRAAKKE